MVWNIIAWWFNHVERTRERALYAKLHEKFYKSGFVNQLSFYGTMKEPYDGRHVQARIEIMSKKVLDKNEVATLLGNFLRFNPVREYSLFVYHRGALIEVEVR